VEEFLALVDTTRLTGRIKEPRVSETLALLVTDVVGELKILPTRDARIRFGCINPAGPRGNGLC